MDVGCNARVADEANANGVLPDVELELFLTRCVSVKIPDRSFLIDIGLVGFGCFTIVWCLMPVQGSWTAKVRKPDGSVQSFRVEDPSDDPDVIHEHLVSQLVPKTSRELGLQRWRAESAGFYAKANTPAPPSTPSLESTSETEVTSDAASSVYQTVSHQAESTTDALVPADSSEQWHAFWLDREQRLTAAIANVEKRQQDYLAGLGDSISVVRETSFVMQRSWLIVALLVSLGVMLIGTLWRALLPPLGFHFNGQPQNIAFAPSTTEGGLDNSTTETAAMHFRASWVRVRQPFRVWSRRACGWLIVITSLVFAIGQFV